MILHFRHFDKMYQFYNATGGHLEGGLEGVNYDKKLVDTDNNLINLFFINLTYMVL